MADAPKPNQMMINQQVINHQMKIMSDLTTRLQYSQTLGKTFDGDRDLYAACGYKRVLVFDDYYNRYTRQDIAKRVVNAYPDATWRVHPDVKDGDGVEQTDFKMTWDALAQKNDFFHYLRRVDRMAGVGQYAVLVLGFDDGGKLDQPVQRAKNLLFLRPCYEKQATIESYDTELTSPRFGLPNMYSIQIDSQKGTSARVHWSRVIHVADNTMDSDVFGIPRLHSVYNRLQDIETIVAGSGEMFWKGAFPGYSFEANPEANWSIDEDQLTDEIEEYMHGLTRYLKLVGVQAKAMTVQVADPASHVKVQIEMLAAESGIPARILLGSESGELASSQDRNNWLERVDERQQNFAEPKVLRPLVQRLADVGVIPAPEKLVITWPDVKVLSEADKATIARNKAEALATYARTPGAEYVIPPSVFITKILGFSTAELTVVQDELKKFEDSPLMDMLKEIQQLKGGVEGRPAKSPKPEGAGQPKERYAGA